ncbi:MAG: hypothetical protein ACOCRU_01075 [bacterium]
MLFGKKLNIFSIALSILLLIVFSGNIIAVDIGGEIKTYLTGAIDDDGNISTDLSQSLDLELYLPSYGQTSSRVRFLIYNPEIIDQYGSTSRINFKNLYLRHSFDDLRVTVGRQPISWSFGSLINPVDFAIGAEVLDQEGLAVYQDAINLRYSINWNSHLELVAANTRADDYKWGFRARTNYQGFDLSANYVKEAIFSLPVSFMDYDQIGGNNQDPITELFSETKLAIDRYGFTFKGDLASFGTHGAFGYYKFRETGNPELDLMLEDPLYAIVLGGDYSYNFDYNRRIIFHAEYLAIQHDFLGNPLIQKELGDVGNRLDFILANIAYPIDDFSSLSLMTMASLGDGSLMLMPVYENEFASNLKLSLMPQFYIGEQGELFSGYTEKGRKRGSFEMSLSYAF